MSDRLREALNYWQATDFEATAVTGGLQLDGDQVLDFGVLFAAARRFLALTETGPDYEAAKALYEQEFPCHCDAAYLDRGRHGPHCEWPYAEDVSRRIVDAALDGVLNQDERT